MSKHSDRVKVPNGHMTLYLRIVHGALRADAGSYPVDPPATHPRYRYPDEVERERSGGGGGGDADAAAAMRAEKQRQQRERREQREAKEAEAETLKEVGVV